MDAELYLCALMAEKNAMRVQRSWLPFGINQHMPTKPAIPTTLDSPEVLQTLGRFADLVEETVNFGTHVLQWHLNSATGGDQTIPITLSLRHILELLDCVSINLRHSCVDPCKLLLRGVLESFFAIAYIVESDTSRRAMAFMAAYAHQRIRTYKRFDVSTEQGRDFLNLLKQDRLASHMAISLPPSVVQSATANMESLLEEPEYKDAIAEYLRRKRAGTGNPYWYSLYGGPRNIEKLADHLKLSGIYHILYRQWSSATHGTDIIQGKITRTETGKGAIRQIRLPTDAQVLTALAVSFGLEVFRAVIIHSAPQRMKDYQAWYVTEIRDLYMRLSGDAIIQIS